MEALAVCIHHLLQARETTRGPVRHAPGFENQCRTMVGPEAGMGESLRESPFEEPGC